MKIRARITAAAASLMLLALLAVPVLLAEPGDPEKSPDAGGAAQPIDWANVTMGQFSGSLAPEAGMAVVDGGASGGIEAAEPATPLVHLVRPGESLFGIAQNYGMSINQIVTLNNIGNPGLIYVGQSIMIGGGAGPVQLPAPAPTQPAYTVQPGDTLARIAAHFGTTVSQLAAANNLSNPNIIHVGQQIIYGSGAPVSQQEAPAPAPTAPTPPAAAEIYTVRIGDSLSGIAARFGIPLGTLAAYNNIVNPSMIYIGQPLSIPGNSSRPAAEDNSEPVGDSWLIWPVESRDIVQYYQYGHGGIDILLPVGSKVVASSDGKVEFAGWNNYGYGNLVVVQSADGLRTVYAHNDTLLVETGQQVKQGEALTLSGNTGNSTMPHLHLEIIIDLAGVNPCSYLPGGC